MSAGHRAEYVILDEVHRMPTPQRNGIVLPPYRFTERRKNMRNALIITQNFDRWWKAETSAGHFATGASPAIALTNLLVAAGVDLDEGFEPIAQGAGNRISEMFELVFPPREDNRDQPASTVR